MTFTTFEFDPRIGAALKQIGFTNPTPIQEQGIPVVLEGKDVLGLAQTGTGKTAAFMLPILQRLTKGPLNRTRALVLAPTRELAEQIHQATEDFSRKMRVRSAAIYGGVGGQCDFIRGASLSPGGVPIIAFKAATAKGVSKVVDMCPEGITTTAIAADPVVLVTEYGALDPRGLSIGERAVGIAHLADDTVKADLLKKVYDGPEFYHTGAALSDGVPKGFTPFAAVG